MKKVHTAVLMSVGLFALQNLNAEDAKVGSSNLKIGWVSQEGVRNTERGKALEQQITEEHKKLAKTVEDAQRAFAAAQTDLNAKSSTLSQIALETEAEKVAKLKRDYEEAVQKSERTLQRKVQEATQAAYQSFAQAAQEYAKKHGFNILLSESGVVYVDESVNASHDIVAIMDNQYKVELAQAQGKTTPAVATKTAAAPAAKPAEAVVAKAAPQAEAKKEAKA